VTVRLRFLIVFLLLALVSSAASSPISTFGQDEAYNAVQLGEEAISLAFKAVLEAENAGANVSGLVQRLNEAVGFLSEARVLAANGSFDREVAEFTSRCVDVADRVRDEALALLASALAHRDFVSRLSVAGSVVGVSVFLSFMFLSWRWFKVYYRRKVLDLRPEAVDDADA